MRSPIPLLALGVTLIAASAAHAQPSLVFPLKGKTAYTANIVSVLDHSGGCFYPSTHKTAACPSDYRVISYAGEISGIVPAGTCDPAKTIENCGFNGPNTSTFQYFLVNGAYVGYAPEGGTAALQYDGHPGYDYSCNSGDEVDAAAEGDLSKPTADWVNNPGGSDPAKYNTLVIDHGDGWQTWYLHTQDEIKTPAHVLAGQRIASCGMTGAASYHLHFEVRRQASGSQQLVVDPYGWEGATKDLIGGNPQATVQLTPLWAGATQPTISNIEISGTSNNYVATLTGDGFLPGSLVALWDVDGGYRVGDAITPTIQSTTHATAVLPIPNLDHYLIKIRSPTGPRSVAIPLKTTSSTTSSNANEISLVGDAAPGGGTYAGFAGFMSATPSGGFVYAAGVDTNGDGIGDVSKVFVSDASGTRAVSLTGSAGIAKIGWDNSGRMAYTSPDGVGGSLSLYYASSPTATASLIASEGQVSPVGGTYHNIVGPIAVGDGGHVAFGAQIYAPSLGTYVGHYVFLYSLADNTITEIAGDGDAAPGGDLFYVPDSGSVAAQIQNNGGIVFRIGLKSSASNGIYYFSKGGIRKIAKTGDPAPSALGGTFGMFDMSTKALNGSTLVFLANIQGGASRQGVFQIDNINDPATAGSKIVAYEGEPINAACGGIFAQADYPSTTTMPFSLYSLPMIRSDGTIFFSSLTKGSMTPAGKPTDHGIFYWSGNSIRSLILDGDVSSSGKTVSGIGSFIINDSGSIRYFAAKVK